MATLTCVVCKYDLYSVIGSATADVLKSEDHLALLKLAASKEQTPRKRRDLISPVIWMVICRIADQVSS